MASLREFSSEKINQAEIKAVAHATERIEIETDQSNPLEPALKLRQQSWAEGMGWFTQKTIRLGLDEAIEMLDDLEHNIVRAKMTRSQAHHRPAQAPGSAATVLQFPVDRIASAPASSLVNEAAVSEYGKLLPFKSVKSGKRIG